MPQVLPVSTQLRDEWEDVLADEKIEPHEIARITVLIEYIDDGTRLALGVLKGGPATRRAYEGIREFEDLHGPIDFEEHTKMRRRHGNDDSAA